MKTSKFLQASCICVALFFGCAQATTSPGGGSTSSTFILTPGTVTNGSMTPASAQTVTTGVATAITATASSGYVFSTWTASPSANASFASAASASTTVTLTGNATITPAFVGTYAVIYDSNGATGGNVPTDGKQYTTGASVTVLSNSGNLTNAGYAFAGWTTSATGLGNSYAVGSIFTMGTANITLYAVWIPNTLTFTSSGTSITITGYTVAPSGTFTIPGGVTGIGEYAFKASVDLTAIGIPESVTDISGYAFYGCSDLVSVSIPDSVTGLGPWIFPFCSKLVSISVDPGNKYYKSDSSYLYDKNGTTLLGVPCGLTGTCTIPGTVIGIGEAAFWGCSGLTSIIIPISVTAIGNVAFSACSNLTSIVIPANVASVGHNAFTGCGGLTVVTVKATTPPAMSSGSQTFSYCPNLQQIDVPAGTLSTYQSAAGWSDYASQIVSP